MKKKIIILFVLISIFAIINTVNAVDNTSEIINTSDDSVNTINNDEVIKVGNKYYNQESEIEVIDSYDDDIIWVDNDSPSISVKIFATNESKYTNDGKIIVECDGNSIEVNPVSSKNYYSVYLSDLIDVNKKASKTVKISFIGTLYKLTNKTSGEILIVPHVKNSTISLKIITGPKTFQTKNEGKFELTSLQYQNLKNYGEEISIYNMKICAGTAKKLSKITWKNKSIFVFKIGKIIKFGKKKFRSIKFASTYIIKTFKMVFKGGKYIKIYKKR